MKITPRIVDSLAEQVEAIQGRIASRAHELWTTRGALLGCALDNWLHAFRVTAPVAGKTQVEVTASS